MDFNQFDPDEDEPSGDYEKRDGGNSGDYERKDSSGSYDRYGKKRDPRSEF